MKQRYLLPFIGCLSLLIIAGLLYWRGIIPPEMFNKKDPFIHGRELLYAGQYLEAEKEFKEVLLRDPANVKALSALGTLYYRQGEMKLAHQYWSDALKIVPQDPTIRGLVKALERDKLQPGPLYHMDIQTVDHAQTWEQHFVRGQNLYLKEEYTKAIKELNEAVELRPDDPKIYFVLGAAYLKVDRRDDAIRAWEKTLGLNPGDEMTAGLLKKIKDKNEQDGRGG